MPSPMSKEKLSLFQPRIWAGRESVPTTSHPRKLRTQLQRSIFTSLCVAYALLGLQRPVQAQENSGNFSGPGPYEVSVSSVDEQGLIFIPSKPSSATSTKLPAVVFAHGLCGPAEKYSDSLTRIASWGFVVLANQKQEDCGVMNVNHPFSTLGNLFQLPVKFGDGVDFEQMSRTVEQNISYLATRSDVDADKLALMGHSMGGGIVLDVASRLAANQPGKVRAIISIAPWNGVKPTPSSVVNAVKAPILIFCSMTDALCPCSGEVSLTDTQGVLSGSITPAIPFLFGPDSSSSWHGGVLSIFNNAQNATLIEVRDVSHFTIMGVGDGEQMQEFADWAHGVSGLNFNRPNRQYSQIPTLNYSIAFLKATLAVDVQAGESVMNQAPYDQRFSAVKVSN